MGDLRIFKSGIPTSEAAQERMRLAAELRAKVLSDPYTNPIFGPAPSAFDKKNPLMPDVDKLDAQFSSDDESIYDEMGKNVLIYAANRDARKEEVTSLSLSFLAGVKDDPESEAARDEIEDAWLNLRESFWAVWNALDCLERGYSALENIFDVVTFGKARDYIAPVAMIDHPRKRFGFDYLGREYFKPYGKSTGARQDAKRIDDYKVSFARAGSVRSGYGKGYGPEAYPIVWKLDKFLQIHAAQAERFGYFPIIATYPQKWSFERAAIEHRRLESQWKNVVMVPGDVDGIILDPKLGQAQASVSTTGEAILSQVRVLTEWLARYQTGGQSTSGSQQQGSFAREKQVSTDRLYKAPSGAACVEAMIARGFIEPCMLVNRPALDRSKWPRAAYDTSFGEDLDMFLKICEFASLHEFPISWVYFSERTKIPIAKDGDQVLAATKTPTAIPQPNAAPLASAEIRMSEPMVRVMRPDGSFRDYHPDDMVYVKGKGRTRAAALPDHSVIVDDPAQFIRAVR